MANVGRTSTSWKKHSIIRDVLFGQCAVMKKRFGRGLIIDMHAGDGVGVEQPQLDLFGENYENPSSATSETAVLIAKMLGDVDVVLCEKKKKSRILIEERFPRHVVIDDHALSPSMIKDYHKWVAVINDPNGYSAHGIEYMDDISKSIISDFIIVQNIGSLKRLMSMGDENEYSHEWPEKVRMLKPIYAWMMDANNWRIRLGKRCLACSKEINASNNFRYRVLIATNFLTDAVIRNPIFRDGIIK